MFAKYLTFYWLKDYSTIRNNIKQSRSPKFFFLSVNNIFTDHANNIRAMLLSSYQTATKAIGSADTTGFTTALT